MKKFVCDICHKDVSQYDLRGLYEEFQPKDIADVCEECYKEIQGAMVRIDEVMKPIKANWLKRIIVKLRR